MATVSPIEMQKHLKGIDYPASKAEIVRAAEKQGANEEIRKTLQQLPDQEFKTPADVSEAIGKRE